jgi:SAM-dependent methyltransferase
MSDAVHLMPDTRAVSTIRFPGARKTALRLAPGAGPDSVFSLARTAAIELAEPRLWRLHSDATNRAFLLGALGGRRFEHALKTDLFDETVTDGVAPVLRALARSTTGIDLSPELVERAQRRHPDIAVRQADVRRLPFEDASFDLVVSLSTLDHLASLAELAAATEELARVLAPGGTLALTVDNLANPVVALRNLLPRGPLRRAGLVAYPVGPTVGPRRLERIVRAAGLSPRVRAALMHCPRLPAVALARRLEGSDLSDARFLRGARAFDVLCRLPSRYLTGYFAAVVAERPVRGPGPPGRSTRRPPR